MTAEWFDLGQRLHAARTGRVVPRLVHSPVPPVGAAVAVRARVEAESVVVTAVEPGTVARTARGAGALAMLGELGVRISAGSARTLVTDDATTLAALMRLARTAAHDGDEGDVAAHLAWWGERADFPGGRAVVPLLAGCRARWVTGLLPQAERHPATWRDCLGVDDDGCEGLLDLLGLLGAGTPLPLLGTLADDDDYSWGRAQTEHADGWDWRRPDTTSRAATGLRARCDAADLYTAALLGDPLYRRRAVHTGHVVVGNADPAPDTGNRVRVTCARMDARLRVGNAVTGWAGSPQDTSPATFAGTVDATGVTAGRLVITLASVSGTRPDLGDPVTLHPAPPNPFTTRAGQTRYRRLYGTRRSWLTTGRTPTPTRRDVPLEVLVAGAEGD